MNMNLTCLKINKWQLQVNGSDVILWLVSYIIIIHTCTYNYILGFVFILLQIRTYYQELNSWLICLATILSIYYIVLMIHTLSIAIVNFLKIRTTYYLRSFHSKLKCPISFENSLWWNTTHVHRYIYDNKPP